MHTHPPVLVHVSRPTHIHTHTITRMLCARLICAYTSIQHTGVHVHTCTHAAHTHTCTCACGLAHPLRLQGGCISSASSSFQISGWVLLHLGLLPPGWEPICHRLPWTPGRAHDVLQAGNSALSIPRALLFLENMWHEIPPWEASLLSQPEVEPPSPASCMPLEGEPSSDHVFAVGSCGQAISLSHSLVWGPVHGSQ